MNLTDLLDELRTKKKIENTVFDSDKYWNFENANLNGVNDFTFINCTFEGILWIDNLKSENVIIDFSNCVFKGKTTIRFSKTYALSFAICDFSDLLVLDSEMKDIKLSEVSAFKDLHFQDCIVEDLTINSKKTKKINRVIVAGKAPEYFSLETMNKVRFLTLRAAKQVNILGDLEILKIDTNQFDFISYENYSKRKNKLKKLEIIDLYYSGNLHFENLLINELSLNNLTCKDGTFRLNEVDIKKADCNNVNINSFFWNQVHFTNELTIERCNFNNLQFANIQWLDGKKISDSFLDEEIPWFYTWRKNGLHQDDIFDEEDLINLRYERETYKQLKAAAISNHLHIEALDFYRNEMRLYWKEVRITGGIPIQNRILIFLNRWVSDFGQSWVLPLIWLFGVHFILFMSLYNWQFSCSVVDFKNGLGQYFQLLNPVHKTPNYINTGMGLVTEFWMRVLGGFFIYHFIKATRKYGKM